MPLLVTVMAVTLLTGLGTVLVVGTMTETAIAAAYRQAVETFYAADAAVEFAIRDLAARGDWDAVLTGAEASALVDGSAAGVRQVGTALVDLDRATAEVDAWLAARAQPPAGGARLYAYGRLDSLLSGMETTPQAYVCVFVAELSSDTEQAPPVRLLYVVSRAYGTTGGRRTVAVTVARALDPDEPPSALQVRAWEEIR